MLYRFAVLLTAGSLAACASSSHPNAASQVTPRPAIAGQWRLNPQESTTARDAMQRGRGEGEGRPGGGEGGGGGFPGRRGMGGGGMRGGGGFRGGGMSDQSRARMRQTMELANHAPTVLWIALTDSSVTFLDDAADTLMLPTNGHKVKEKVEDGGDVERKADWTNAGLVLEEKVSGGGSVTETYVRPSDGKELYVIVKVKMGRMPQPLEFRRVYEPADSAAGGS